MRKTIFKKLEAQGLITNYNRLRKNLPPKLPKKVYIWDETFREALKAPTVFLTYVEQVKLAKLMDETGIAIINVGFPALSEGEKHNVKRIVNETFKNATLTASAEPTKESVSACLECGIKEVTIETPFNQLNLQYRLKATKQQTLKKTVEAIEHAREHGANVNFTLIDGTRTPIEDILQIFEAAVKAKADRLVIGDTVGFLRPLSMRYLISTVSDGLSEAVKEAVPLSVHCHNDFGLATANTLAAVEEGVTYVHTCVAGFGERSGCAPLEEVCAALELLYDMDTGLELDKLYRLSQLAEKTFALPIQFHKPIIGENSFSYESDEHVRAMLANPLTYEPFPPEIVGRETMFYLGRQTGKNLIESRLAQAEIKVTPIQVEEIVRRIKGTRESLDKGEAQMIFYQIKRLLKDLRKGLTEEEFWKIVEQVTKQKPKLPQPAAPLPT